MALLDSRMENSEASAKSKELSPWMGVLEWPPVPQPVTHFLTLYGTRTLIAARDISPLGPALSNM